MRGLSLVAASGGHSSSRCAGLSLSRPLLLRSTGSRRAGSVIVAQGPSCSAACGIFPDQGSNPCPLLWQADSQPLRHQGSPWTLLVQDKAPPGPSLQGYRFAFPSELPCPWGLPRPSSTLLVTFDPVFPSWKVTGVEALRLSPSSPGAQGLTHSPLWF